MRKGIQKEVNDILLMHHGSVKVFITDPIK